MRLVEYDFPVPGALVRVPTVDRPLAVRTNASRRSTISRLLSDAPSQQHDEVFASCEGWVARLARALK